MDSLQLSFVALGVAGLAVLIALLAIWQLAKARKQLKQLDQGDGPTDILTVASTQAVQIEDLRQSLTRTNLKLGEVQAEVSSSLRHLSVVRFNALSDIGGRFSFSAALLDDNVNGIVFTSIQGHQQARIYAKAIFGGECDVPLSPEEEQAIEAANPRGGK